MLQRFQRAIENYFKGREAVKFMPLICCGHLQRIGEEPPFEKNLFPPLCIIESSYNCQKRMFMSSLIDMKETATAVGTLGKF